MNNKPISNGVLKRFFSRLPHRQRQILIAFLVASPILITLGMLVSGNLSPVLSMHTADAVEQSKKATQITKQTPSEGILKLSKDEIPLLQSLQKRQADLFKREQSVSKREEELEQLKIYLEEKLANVNMLRHEIGELIKEREAFEERRFEHLVKVYEGMKPAEAGPLLERLNKETAAKLFYRMKEQKVSRILGFIKPEIAVQLSEYLASYPSTNEQAPPKGRR